MATEEGRAVTHWIGDLNSGGQDAASRLWGRYFDGLVLIARDCLREAPRGNADEEDGLHRTLTLTIEFRSINHHSLSVIAGPVRLPESTTKCNIPPASKGECIRKGVSGTVFKVKKLLTLYFDI